VKLPCSGAAEPYFERKKGRPMAAFPALERLHQQNKYVAYSDVQTQEACNKDDNDHYADDVENVHCVTPIAVCAISI
jgi:hypothetical protein